jgi:Pentapeptide repeats (8 copies)
VAATLAWALDQVNDYWWADKHWLTAAGNPDPYLRATACSYWGMALCNRGDFSRARSVVTKALDRLPAGDADAFILDGGICLNMAGWDPKGAGEWVARARRAFSAMPKNDGRYDTYLPGGKPYLNLISASLAGAQLGNADLSGADLAGADLTGADLTGADLTGADLSGATLSGANLAGAIVADTGPFPPGWEPDAASGRLVPVPA